MMKKNTLTLSIIFIFCLSTFAQINGSIKLGLSGFQGDLHCRSDENIGVFDDLGFSFGVGIQYPLNNNFGLRAEASYFKLSGDETNFADAGHQNRAWSFENNFFEFSGLLDWEILGHKRFLENGDFKKTFTPVIFGGFGLGFNQPVVDWNTSRTSETIDDNHKAEKWVLAVPIGLGLKYYMSERFAIALETGLRLPLSDYIDGVSVAGNPDQNDAFAFGGVKAYFALWKK